MDSLHDTEWDVLIAGTGIQQSLLALALSRSGKKVLHIDRNDFYGEAEAAFSLQEAESWMNRVSQEKQSPSQSSYFSDVSISRPESMSEVQDATKLSFSRAYSLALAPQLVYTHSRLIDALVSSKVHRQLEFLAMGSWWTYSGGNSQRQKSGDVEQETRSEEHSDASSQEEAKLLKIPTNREDVAFSDSSLDLRAKRSLMKILRFIMDFENQTETWEPYSSRPFSDFLSEQFKLPSSLHDMLIALTLTPFPPPQTTTNFALPRIARHLRSTGRLGPGFSSIIPRWGGISEIVQVACRAAAVGGAVYVLDKDIVSVASRMLPNMVEENPTQAALDHVTLELEKGDTVAARWVVGTEDDFEALTDTTDYEQPLATEMPHAFTRSISIVSSPLKSLFPVVEGAQPPAGAVVVFPSGSITLPEGVTMEREELPPVYLILHSSDTGECPAGQSVVYASVGLSISHGKLLLASALDELLRITGEASQARILWNLRYEQHSPHSRGQPRLENQKIYKRERFLKLPSPSMDLVFDDGVLDSVRWAWQKIMGGEADSDQFLVFLEREGQEEDDGS